MSRPLILGALGALLAATSAHALETPTPGPRDKRVRVVEYDPDEVVKLYAAPGSTVRIAIASDETVEALLVSDQGIMSGETEADTTGVADTGAGTGRPEQPGDPNKACDTNMCRSIYGSYIYIKPNRELEPQPLHFQTKRNCKTAADGQAKCEWRAYQFELLTRPGPLTEGTPDTFYSVRFDYPADRAAAERARVAAAAGRARAAWAARRSAAERAAEEARAKAAEDLLRSQHPAVVNRSYTVRGDRAVLGIAR